MVLLHAKQPTESADEPAVHRRDYEGKGVGVGAEMEIDHHLLL